MNNSLKTNRPGRSGRIHAKWQQHITAQQASGLTQAAYCREQGVDAKYFSLWKSKLAKPEAMAPAAVTETAKPKLIPVIIKRQATPVAEPLPATSTCTVPSNEVVLKALLPNGIALEFVFHSVQALFPLLSELAQLPC